MRGTRNHLSWARHRFSLRQIWHCPRLPGRGCQLERRRVQTFSTNRASQRASAALRPSYTSLSHTCSPHFLASLTVDVNLESPATSSGAHLFHPLHPDRPRSAQVLGVLKTEKGGSESHKRGAGGWSVESTIVFTVGRYNADVPNETSRFLVKTAANRNLAAHQLSLFQDLFFRAFDPSHIFFFV